MHLPDTRVTDLHRNPRRCLTVTGLAILILAAGPVETLRAQEIGRASCRERVCLYV